MPGAAHTPASVFGASGWPGLRGALAGAGEGLPRRALFHLAVRGAQQFLGDRVDRLGSLRADAHQLDHGAFARAQREQADHALDRGLALAEMDMHLGVEPTRRFPGARGRPRMQPARVGQRDLATRLHRVGHVARGGGHFRGARAQRQQRRLASTHHAAAGALDDLEGFRIRDGDHRDQARRGLRDQVRIEFDQHVAGSHPRARIDPRREAPAVQLDRVDADVQQHLGALGGGDA